MPLTLEELEKNARELSRHERALLAHRLIDSLDETASDEWPEESGAIQQAWLEEAEKRLHDHEKNPVSHDHDEFLGKLEALLNEKS